MYGYPYINHKIYESSTDPLFKANTFNTYFNNMENLNSLYANPISNNRITLLKTKCNQILHFKTITRQEIFNIIFNMREHSDPG